MADFIKCSKCKCKYNNKENDIIINFGYNRLNERYKTCIKCRDNRKKDKETIDHMGIFDEILHTLSTYGFIVYTESDLKYVARNQIMDHIMNTKSAFLMYLSKTVNPELYDIVYDLFGGRIKLKTKTPHLVYAIRLSEENDYMTVRYISIGNVFENYLQSVKLINRRRCDICLEKKKCFRECGKCKNKCCVNCFYRIHDTILKPCPFCRYTFEDHIQNEFERLGCVRGDW